MRKFFILLSFLALTFFLDSNFSLADDLPNKEVILEKAVVTRILSEKHDKDLEKIFNTEQIIQVLNIKILSGELKDKEVKVKNYLTNNPEYDIKIKEGDRVIIEKDTEDDADEQEVKTKKEVEDDADETDDDINITAKDNSPIILIVSGIFMLALLLIGGYKGLQTLISILFTASLVAFVLIPAILTGISVIPTAIGVGILAALFGIFLTNGINLKSTSASLGAALSLIITGAISAGIIYLSEINSIDSKEGLVLLNQYPDLNFSGILTASVIISTLGAIMSVATAISNYIAKVKKTNPDYGFKKLFKKGTTAGKEAVGTMVSTLVFAYLGLALPLLLLAFSVPFLKFINLEVVITEISAAIVGGLAIILCSPITSAIGAGIFGKIKTKEEV